MHALADNPYNAVVHVCALPALLSLTLPFNLLGWPAVSVPAPQTTGLPAGIQLAAVRGGEQLLLATAARLTTR